MRTNCSSLSSSIARAASRSPSLRAIPARFASTYAAAASHESSANGCSVSSNTTHIAGRTPEPPAGISAMFTGDGISSGEPASSRNASRLSAEQLVGGGEVADGGAARAERVDGDRLARAEARRGARARCSASNHSSAAASESFAIPSCSPSACTARHWARTSPSSTASSRLSRA